VSSANRPNVVMTSQLGFLAVLTVAVVLTRPVAPAYGDTARSYWHVRNGVAHTTMEYPRAKQPGVTATLTVEFGSLGSTCRRMIGIAVLQGSAYGSTLDRGTASGRMTVIVPGHGTWSASPQVIKYSNGVEAGIAAPDDLMRALRVGKMVKVAPIQGAAPFEFSLFGAGSAFDQATRNLSSCR
jgi:hypothetical protein